jgi:hypothetical protein
LFAKNIVLFLAFLAAYPTLGSGVFKGKLRV